MGVAGRIFEIREDDQLARPLASYSAIGFGAPIALGALQALEDVEPLSLEGRVRRALEAAEQYSAVVRGPFHVVEAPAQAAETVTPPPRVDACRPAESPFG